MAQFRTFAVLAVIAVCALLGAAASNEFAPPRIETVPVPGDEPLTLRFAVSNRGYLSTLRDIDFICVPDQVVGRDAGGNIVRVHGTPFPLKVGIDLGPLASFQYTCPLSGSIKDPRLPAQVTRIEAHVEMSYTRFGRRLDAHSAELIWDSQSKIWTAAR